MCAEGKAMAAEKTQNSTPTVIRVGSRSSELAMIQSQTIVTALEKLHPDVTCKITTMKTIGDKILDKPLPNIGQTNLFTKELETALAEGKIDLIVHSLKDLPTTIAPEMTVSVIFKRDKSTDAVVLHPKHKGKRLQDLPDGSVVGTSSLRRIAQLKRSCPDLVFKSVRGNLNTRLKKLDESGDYDALVLATAGLERLGWHDRIDQELDSTQCMYAVGQGALAIETRVNDSVTNALLEPLNDVETVLCCAAERSFLHSLGGGCSVPVGVFSEVKEGELFLEGAVFSLDGSKMIKSSVGTRLPSDYVEKGLSLWHSQGEELGRELGHELLAKGATPILEEAKEEGGVNKTL
jgi:hydroxymethylbilane synthase